MLSRRTRKLQREFERVGVSVSSDHAWREARRLEEERRIEKELRYDTDEH